MPKIYIIAGCNGAGKTTASYTVLPQVLKCTEFINADNIAKGLSPFNVEGVAINSGRIMLTRIKELISQKVDFAFETTLAAKSYLKLLEYAKQKGYEIHLIFFWLKTVQLAEERVLKRFASGGHNIEKSTIVRRYSAGLQNLHTLYMPFVTSWMIFDNSDTNHVLIAEQAAGEPITIYNKEIYFKIINQDEH